MCRFNYKSLMHRVTGVHRVRVTAQEVGYTYFNSSNVAQNLHKTAKANLKTYVYALSLIHI